MYLSDQSKISEVGFFEPNPHELHFNSDNILRWLGMKPNDVDPYLDNLIENLYKECLELSLPIAEYILINDVVFLPDNKINLNSIGFNTSKIIASMLKKNDGIVVFACTIGSNIEQFSKEQMQLKNTLESYIIDLIGSELVEGLADYVQDNFWRKVNEAEIGTTNRFSPGYCNWDVREQHKLFSLLKFKKCNIHLTESSLMVPVKSVSGVFGVGKGLKRTGYKCNLCNDSNCKLRNY